MGNYFFSYCTLLSSFDQLTYCRQACSLGDLLARVKSLWNCLHLDDNELLGEISRLNQTPIDDSVKMTGLWLPYRYQPQFKLVHWLLPAGHATEPFQDEYISRCRQQLFNQIFQPRSTLNMAIQQGKALVAVQPAGFIFHLSRCGSTLMSGCLSELANTCVFSESPLLTELLLDNQLTVDAQQKTVSAFINLQAAVFPERPKMIIKWNAWDIFKWELIHNVYPQVPVIFLVRDPLEILASHQKAAGRHMVFDRSMEHFHPIFSNGDESLTLLEKRISVLTCLLHKMRDVFFPSRIKVLDYRQLDIDNIFAAIDYFGLGNCDAVAEKIRNRMQFHSKSPGQIFTQDTRQKQHCFRPEEREKIYQQLNSIYLDLLYAV